MLLTQYSKHLILISQSSALTLVTHWQSKKNRDIKATRVHRVKASVSLDGNRATLAKPEFSGSSQTGIRETFSFLRDEPIHRRVKPVPVLQYLRVHHVHASVPANPPSPVQPSLSYWMMSRTYVPMLRVPLSPSQVHKFG